MEFKRICMNKKRNLKLRTILSTIHTALDPLRSSQIVRTRFLTSDKEVCPIQGSAEIQKMNANFNKATHRKNFKYQSHSSTAACMMA